MGCKCMQKLLFLMLIKLISELLGFAALIAIVLKFLRINPITNWSWLHVLIVFIISDIFYGWASHIYKRTKRIERLKTQYERGKAISTIDIIETFGKCNPEMIEKCINGKLFK